MNINFQTLIDSIKSKQFIIYNEIVNYLNNGTTIHITKQLENEPIEWQKTFTYPEEFELFMDGLKLYVQSPFSI
jgi:hypothetical protein